MMRYVVFTGKSGCPLEMKGPSCDVHEPYPDPGHTGPFRQVARQAAQKLGKIGASVNVFTETFDFYEVAKFVLEEPIDKSLDRALALSHDGSGKNSQQKGSEASRHQGISQHRTRRERNDQNNRPETKIDRLSSPFHPVRQGGREAKTHDGHNGRIVMPADLVYDKEKIAHGRDRSGDQ